MLKGLNINTCIYKMSSDMFTFSNDFCEMQGCKVNEKQNLGIGK